MKRRGAVAAASVTVAFLLAAATAAADRDSIGGLSIQPDGRIVAVGQVNADSATHSSEFGLARYTAAGILDTSLSEDGKQTENFGRRAKAKAVARQADGKLVVVGSSWATSTDFQGGGFAVARFDSLGNLDPSFSDDGRLVLDLSSFSEANSVAIDPSGGIIVAGTGGVIRLTPRALSIPPSQATGWHPSRTGESLASRSKAMARSCSQDAMASLKVSATR